MQAVITAGGLGTRLRPLTNDVPKPMVEVLGRPYLEYEIAMLRQSGVDEIVLCVGYLAQKIVDYFDDGSKFGIKIQYSFEDKLLCPPGALKKAEPLLRESFFLTHGDSYLLLDYAGAMKEFLASGKLAMMVVYENHDQYGCSDVVVREGYVAKYAKHAHSEDMVWINYGVVFLKRGALELIPPGVPVGEEEFFGKLIERKELLAYETKNRFYEIGTMQALKEFQNAIAKNIRFD